MIFGWQFKSKSPSVVTNDVFLNKWQRNLCIRIHKSSLLLTFFLKIGYKRRNSKSSSHNNSETNQHRGNTLQKKKIVSSSYIQQKLSKFPILQKTIIDIIKLY